MSVIPISATEDGRLLTMGSGTEPKRWIEVEPLVFEEGDSQEKMAFRQDDQGRITHLFLGGFPPIAFAKLTPVETPVFHFTVLGVSSLFLLSGTVLWPIHAFRNHRRGIRHAALARLARLFAWVVSGLCIGFLIGMAATMANPMEIAFGIPPLLRRWLVLPLLAAALMIGPLAFTVLAWKKVYWSFGGRVHYTLVTLAGLAFLWWLNHWNLLGYHFTPER